MELIVCGDHYDLFKRYDVLLLLTALFYVVSNWNESYFWNEISSYCSDVIIKSIVTYYQV